MANTNAVPTVTLNNGVEMPILGFGVYQIPAEQTEETVLHALEAGYRSLDTAAGYQNEEAVGRAIAASGIPREELFVTTKLWIQKQPGEEPVRRAFDTSRERLGLDYLDLYLIHQPLGDYYSAWRAMEAANSEGVAKVHRRCELLPRPAHRPGHPQRGHPRGQPDRDTSVLPAPRRPGPMREHGIQIESWGPFAEGRNDLFTDPVLSRIGAEHGKSVGQVVLRWLIQRNVVVIPKTVRPERMRENIDVFDFTLTDEQMAQIAAMDTGATLFFDHRDPEMVTWLNGRAQ